MSESQPPALLKAAPLSAWFHIVRTLRQHPGVYHLIRDDRTTAITNINEGVIVDFRPAGSFHARRDREGRLYVAAVADTEATS